MRLLEEARHHFGGPLGSSRSWLKGSDWADWREVMDIERSIDSALKENRSDDASELIQPERSLLNRELELRHDDDSLRLFDGHWHKNSAMMNQRAGQATRAEADLLRSEGAFRAVIESEPNHPTALSGLGSAAVLRGDLGRAELLIDESLRVAPDRRTAREELGRIRSLRAIEDESD